MGKFIVGAVAVVAVAGGYLFWRGWKNQFDEK